VIILIKIPSRLGSSILLKNSHIAQHISNIRNAQGLKPNLNKPPDGTAKAGALIPAEAKARVYLALFRAPLLLTYA
jgi:hypothetical protein